MGKPFIRSIVKTKEEVDKIVAKCFLWSDIPFNIAKNPFYHSMFEVVAIVGPRYKGPSYNDLRGPLLQGEKVDYIKRLDELRESWEIIGCTIMSNSWTDGKGGSILNFLVNCSRGIIQSYRIRPNWSSDLDLIRTGTVDSWIRRDSVQNL
jgi:hypothetical protein